MQSLHQFLDEHHVHYVEGGTHRHVRYGWTGLQCPWCQTQSWHLGIRNSDGYVSCWRCGSHRLADVLMAICQLPYSGVANIVREIKHQAPSQTNETVSRRAGKVTLPQYREPLRTPHRAYLRRRGFNPDRIAKLWHVEGIGPYSRLKWRLFLPITIRGEVVSWTTRAIGNRPIRYISASPQEESVNHKEVLYGVDYAQHGIVVVEGPTDVWRIGAGAVGVLGLNISGRQCLDIGAYPYRAICFDNSDQAQRRAEDLAKRIDAYRGETEIIRIKSGDDPASMEEAELRELRNRLDL